MPWRSAADGVRITVRLTPRAARDALDGVIEQADGSRVLQARVRAVPEDGRANAALIRLVAGELGLARIRVRLLEGAKTRLKVLLVEGDAAALAHDLDVRFG